MVIHSITIRIVAVLMGAALSGIPQAAQAQSDRIPWEWVMEWQESAQEQQCPLSSFMRSRPLPSPDQTWNVYSRLDLHVKPDGEAQLTSLLFARHLPTGRLHQIYSSSLVRSEPDFNLAVLLPFAWQQDQLLVRERQGILQSDVLIDWAVIWQTDSLDSVIGDSLTGNRFNSPTLVASTSLMASVQSQTSAQIQVRQPPRPQSITELLGWDPQAPNQVLFRLGEMGDDTSQVISLGSGRPLVRNQWDIATLSSSANPDPEFHPPLLTQSPDWQMALPQGSQCHHTMLL
ncbi:MAG: hypothetical protein HC924_00730 [Synechococcaceae cyanobacterium SM2_3_2]|nr:hypothetical protein [Synechococcaceae cyanobacterium SM2_3_2]